MKYIVVVLALIFNVAAQAVSYDECYSKKDGGDVCIEHTFSVTNFPEKFSVEYFDALIDNSGRTVWDAAISGAQSWGAGIGQDIAQQAAIKFAEAFGWDPIVDFLGGGSRGPSQIEILDQMLSFYSQQIINEVKLTENRIVDVIQLQCSGAADVDYLNLTSQMAMFHTDTYEKKKSHSNMTTLNYNILKLGRLREEYGSVREDYCFHGSHPEYFYWFNRLVQTEINAIVTRENIEYEGSEEFDEVLRDNLRVVIANDFKNGGVERVIKALESPAEEDQNNEWWYEIERNFSAPRESEGYYYGGEVPSDVAAAIYVKTLELYDKYSHVFDPVTVKPYSPSVSKNLFSYSYDGVNYPLYKTVFSYYLHNKVTPTQSETLRFEIVSSPFLEVTYDEIKVISSTRANDPYILRVIEEHKKYAYAQLLQKTYAPYQALLDGWWKFVGLDRPSNKMDRELSRTSAFDVLDHDGLSVAEEFKLGTNPRKDDTDEDGFDDGFEFFHSAKGFDPLASHDYYSDYDADGESDLDEYAAGTDMFDYEDNQEVRAKRQRLAAIMVPITALILN